LVDGGRGGRMISHELRERESVSELQKKLGLNLTCNIYLIKMVPTVGR